MYKMIAAMLACALLTTLTVVDAQDTGDSKAKTQGDIMRERAKACAGLKDAALHECLDNYVGPTRDATTGEAEHRAPTEKKAQDPRERAEQEGSSQVDMTKSNTRAPVGPVKSQSDGEKQ